MVRVRSEICLSCAPGTGQHRETGGQGGGTIAAPPSTHQRVGLPDLVRRLLEPPLGRVDPPVAIVDVLLHVAQVVVFEGVPCLLGRTETIVLGLECFAMDSWACAKVLFRIGEEVVRAGADDERAADLCVC